ncbi:MAG TPA: PRC-barrel domain-containing protein [Planctomycetaceae bacterium]|jgi:sporulation protein YlmC with PRC-barrel domain
MCKSKLSLLGSITLVVAACFTALAAAPPKGANDSVGNNPVIRARHIEGMAVRNAAGEDLGKVEDIVVDMKTGNIRYAAIAFGGFLGVGDKLFAVPWHALRVVHDAKANKTHFETSIDKQTLKNATGFDKKSWPDFADPKFGENNDKHFAPHVTSTAR